MNKKEQLMIGLVMRPLLKVTAPQVDLAAVEQQALIPMISTTFSVIFLVTLWEEAQEKPEHRQVLKVLT